MAQVYISVGSNIEPQRHIRSCLQSLQNRFAPLIVSTVYRTKAVGFAGDDFFNLAVGFTTTLTPQQVAAILRTIEADHGRRRDGPRLAPRTLDLDLLLYGNLIVEEQNLQIPRLEITRCAFVLCPLAEIAGKRRHPKLGSTLAVLWQRLAQHTRESLAPVSRF